MLVLSVRLGILDCVQVGHHAVWTVIVLRRWWLLVWLQQGVVLRKEPHLMH